MPVELRRYRVGDLPDIRALLLEVYAEVWADEVATDPFMSVERFDDRLSRHTASPGWETVIGYDGDDPVGYAYGSPVAAGRDSRWDSVRPQPDPEFCRESGTRTFVLFELMVRLPWRKTGTAQRIHHELLAGRAEERVTLFVDPAHPKVQALYEAWGYRCIGHSSPFPDAPNFSVMIRDVR
jgi:hypothetical protein